MLSMVPRISEIWRLDWRMSSMLATTCETTSPP